MINRSGILAALVLSLAGLALASCQGPPITLIELIERAIEARSTSDIVDDNRIVIEVNGVVFTIAIVVAIDV